MNITTTEKIKVSTFDGTNIDEIVGLMPTVRYTATHHSDQPSELTIEFRNFGMVSVEEGDTLIVSQVFEGTTRLTTLKISDKAGDVVYHAECTETIRPEYDAPESISTALGKLQDYLRSEDF